MSLITRYLIIDTLDNVHAVKYTREEGIKSLLEWRLTGGTYALVLETAILASPQYTQERVIIGFADPIISTN